MTIVDVEGGRLNHDAAASYNRARAAGLPAGITSSFRSRAEQKRLYDLWRKGKGSFALPPGSSKHETGYSLDLPGNARTWMNVHGKTFGWYRTNPNESWHFDYLPEHDQRRTNRDPGLSARIQRAMRQPDDGYFGDASRYALALLQNHVLGVYPNPVDLQHVVGAKDDGIVGPETKRLANATIAQIQLELGLTPDGVWGPKTEAAVSRFLAENYKTW